ncbi:MAG: dihydrolipoyl dehydrogenase family protein [Acidimicrobiales bacterium]
MDYDLVVAGGGAGGLAAARTAARRRARVALVHDGRLGGDCTFVGCVPSKTMIESAAQGEGFAAAMSRVHQVVERIAATEAPDVLRAEGVDVIEGRAELLSGGRPWVELSAGGTRHRARQVVIATGSAPVVPPVAGLDGSGPPVVTNENVFELTELPSCLVVVGGGPIGVELAQAFARLGSRVTVVEGAGRLLGREEAEASGIVTAALVANGVTVVTGHQVAGAGSGDGGDGARGHVRLDDGRVISADAVLVAVGRRPITDGLGLEAAGVAVDGRGWVRTDRHMRTNVANIWAAGDIAGGLQFTHAADEMGRIAANNALSKVPYRRFRDGDVPGVTFTDPEVARVGLTETAAAASVEGARVAYLPMTEVDRAVTAGRTEGYVKLVVGPRRLTRDLAGGRLVGATVVAPRAGEMVHEAALIMRGGMFPARLALTTHAYPTWSLAIRQAAAQLFMEVNGRRARPAQAP